jgi:hypothetical protein
MSREGQTRPLWPTVLVVIGSLALVGFFVYSLGDRADPTALGDQVGPEVSPSVAPSPELSPGPTESPTPGPTGGSTSGPAASPEPPPPTPSPSVPPQVLVPVAVLNQTAVPGLAARSAAVLETDGWEVVTVGDASLGAPSTTLYVPLGLDAAAESFVAAFPAVVRSRPAFAGLPPGQLTLVLAEPDAESVVAALESDAAPVVAVGLPRPVGRFS